MASTRPSTSTKQSYPKPSDLQLAFALAIVQTKPERSTILEYISQLRASLRSGRSQHRYLDTERYWQQQCAAEKAEKERFQIENIELQRKLDRVQKQLDETPRAGAASISISRRRRDTDDETTSQAYSTQLVKKRKITQTASASFQSESNEASILDDYEALSALGVGSMLVQHLYQSHKIIKDSKISSGSLDTRLLSYHLVQGSSALASVLDAACKSYQQHVTKTPSLNNTRTGRQKEGPREAVSVGYKAALMSTFAATARAFDALFHSVTKLGHSNASREERSAAIHGFVSSFSRMLDTLTEVSLMQATQDINHPDDSTSSAIKTRSSRRKHKSAHTNQKPPGSPLEVSQVLSAITTFPYSTDLVHRELLEGYLFVLLGRIGKWLYVCNFHHHRGSTIEEDIRVGAAATDTATETTQQGKIEIRAMSIELPHLLHLFEHTMALAPQLICPPNNSFAGSKAVKPARAKTVNLTTFKTSASAPKANLTLAAKNKLQQTLVNAMFGDDGNDEFMDCLRMPLQPSSTLQAPEVDEPNVKDWFKQEVWRILGWEILGHGVDW